MKHMANIFYREYDCKLDLHLSKLWKWRSFPLPKFELCYLPTILLRIYRVFVVQRCTTRNFFYTEERFTFLVKLPLRLDTQDCVDGGFCESPAFSLTGACTSSSFSLWIFFLVRSEFSSTTARDAVPSWDNGVAETSCGLVSEAWRLNRRIAIAWKKKGDAAIRELNAPIKLNETKITLPFNNLSNAAKLVEHL